MKRQRRGVLLRRSITSGLVCSLCAICAVAPSRAQTSADFSKLTLKQAITLAQQNSSDLKVARMQYNVARSEVGVERANFFPNLYTGSGAAYTHGFPSLPGGNAPALFQLNYEQTLFNPSIKSQQRAAEERAKSMKLEVDRIQDDVIARTATAYLELAKVKRSLDLLATEEASASRIIEVTRQRIAANQELPIEGTKSELALAQVHERIVKLQSQDEILSRQLRDLTGVSDRQPLDVVRPEQPIDAALVARSDDEIVGLAMRSDKRIAEAENDRAAKQQLLKGAQLSYYPTIDLVGQYSLLSKFNNYDQFYTSFQRNNVNIGVQISIPIFSAKTRANVVLAKSQLQASEAALENERVIVRSDVREKQRTLREGEAAREVARLSLQLAQETLTQQQARLQQGQVTIGDVEQAQLDQSEKWVEFLDADFALQKAQIKLLQSTGQLAQVFQ